MMSRSGNATHDATVIAAEGVRQRRSGGRDAGGDEHRDDRVLPERCLRARWRTASTLGRFFLP